MEEDRQEEKKVEKERKSDEGSTRCGECMVHEEKEKERERKRRRTRDGKNGKGGQGNKNVVDGEGCRCGGATVRTRRVYLSCFYRLERRNPGRGRERR